MVLFKLNSPRNLLMIEEADILKKTVLLSVAIALASRVFPHPGDLDAMVEYVRQSERKTMANASKSHNRMVNSPV